MSEPPKGRKRKAVEEKPKEEEQPEPQDDDSGGEESGQDVDTDDEEGLQVLEEAATTNMDSISSELGNMTEEQLKRFEVFRRSTFPRSHIKKIMQNVTGHAPTPIMLIVMSGVVKVFIGQVIEAASKYMQERQESGPLRPRHLREAVRRLKERGLVPSTAPPAPLFKR